MFSSIFNNIKFAITAFFYPFGPLIKKEKCSCGNLLEEKEFTVNVLGRDVKLLKSVHCLNCCERRLNDESVLCSTCKEPILPGTSFGGSVNDGGVVHYTMECSFPGSYVGIWEKEYKKDLGNFFNV